LLDEFVIETSKRFVVSKIILPLCSVSKQPLVRLFEEMAKLWLQPEFCLSKTSRKAEKAEVAPSFFHWL
jgi:hypothetical protein